MRAESAVWQEEGGQGRAWRGAAEVRGFKGFCVSLAADGFPPPRRSPTADVRSPDSRGLANPSECNTFTALRVPALIEALGGEVSCSANAGPFFLTRLVESLPSGLTPVSLLFALPTDVTEICEVQMLSVYRVRGHPDVTGVSALT